MKSTTVALGFLAGVASASYNHPRHFHAPRFYRRDNVTASASSSSVEAATASQTTLTVQITQTHTVISCAPTVTNCPAANNTQAISNLPQSMLTTAVVTNVVDLTTTVCPVTAAESVSKSVVEAHNSGVIPGKTYPAVPAPTGKGNGPASSANVPKPGESVSTSLSTTENVLTMTVGPSTAKSVLTTTIKSTYTHMVTVTMTAPGTKETSANSPVPGGEAGKGGSKPAGPEGTTTMTSTSTGTRTVTVARPSTATEKAPLPTGGNQSPATNPGLPGAAGEGECVCPSAPAPPAAVTVTVTSTAAASTVYITAPAAAATTGVSPGASTGEKPAPGSDKPAAGSDKPAAGGDKPAPGAEGQEDDCPPEEVTQTSVATVVPVPYPTGNGTYPTGAARPTGAAALKY